MSTFNDISTFVSSYFSPVSKTRLRKNPRAELILLQYYPFYLKLTDNYKEQFWNRLEEVFAAVKIEFQDNEDYDNFKYQLLIAAEITHYSIGQKHFTVNEMPILIETLSAKEESILGAEKVNNQIIIHWEKFLDEISRTEETGLVVTILDQLYHLQLKSIDSVLKASFLNVKTFNKQRRSLFNVYDVTDTPTFYKACLRSYFLFPEELRNIHPKIFRHVDYVLFNGK
jgi:hypothetical protein